MLKPTLAVVLAIIVVLGIGYWYETTLPAAQPVSQTTTSTTTTTATTTGDGTPIADNLTLGTDSAAGVGTYLIAYNGMTLYTYAKDTDGVSNCTGVCATAWPPYTVPAGMQLNLESGVSGSAGTLVRADGTTQVTYNGAPLYFYSKDLASGDINGQAVGGVWYVVKP